MKPTFPLPRSTASSAPPPAVSTASDVRNKAAVEDAPPEAARRFQALLAKRQGTPTTGALAAGAEKDAATEYADAGDASESPEHAGTRGAHAAPRGTLPDPAADRFAAPDAFGHADAADKTDTTPAGDATDAGWTDTAGDDSIHDAEPAQIDTEGGDAKPDKRSWGIGSPLSGTPPTAPRPPASGGGASVKSLAGFDGTARKSTRSRGAIGVGAANAHRLHDPAGRDDDLAASRTEALSHLVSHLLAQHTPADRHALAKDIGADTDALHGDLSAPISIRVDHVFPETLLTLTISEPSLSLRFQSPSAESRALLSEQRNALASRVTLRTGRATHIEIVA